MHLNARIASGGQLAGMLDGTSQSADTTSGKGAACLTRLVTHTPSTTRREQRQQSLPLTYATSTTTATLTNTVVATITTTCEYSGNAQFMLLVLGHRLKNETTRRYLLLELRSF
jgi:hypothetical protein